MLAFAMVLTLCPTIALAGDTLPYTGDSALAENEPTSHGYRAEDLLSWDPATDPYAELLRARVPLQSRIEAVAATQANPELDSEVQYLTLAGDYGNAFFGGTSYTNEFSEYCFNFWQYVDYYASWHGQVTAETPFELWDSEGERNGTSDWQSRTFEFGMLNLPSAAYTNAAHKNGVLSLGCIFLPRAYQSWRTLIERDEDGNFPYAEKIIEITEYYGFDGWFVNLEGSDSPSGEAKTELEAFLKTLRDAGLYIQYYNAGGSIDTEMMEAGAADSFFKDYGWTTSGAITETATYGITAVMGGFEAGGNRWTNTFSKMWSNGEIVCSIATLGTDFVHAGIDEDFGNYLELRRETDEFQWMSAVRERMWFTGSSGNPTDSTTYSNSEVGVSSNSMPGIASLITERSVVSGDTFYTNFNTGHGLVYAIDGEISNSNEWANMNIQDILPTWQFWFETEGTELNAEYDYGTTYKKALTWDDDGDYTYGEFDFDLVDPYNGGSSLAIYGKVDADNFMHLYKTDLDVTSSTKVSLTFKKTSTDNVSMSLGVVFAKDIDEENDTYTLTSIAIDNTTATSSDWVTVTVDLSAYAGESIAMLGLTFSGTSDDYQMHIGQISYTSGKNLTPDAPTGLTIEKAYDTNEMVISWDLDDYDTVKQYNVYAVINGTEMYMGGIYDEIYYIKDLYDATGEVTIKVTAVGADGTESAAATATYDYSKAVSDLSVDAADGTLTVSFTPADATVATDVSVYIAETGATYTATAAAGETSVVVTVPSGADADGKDYTMTVTPAGGSAKTYDGELDDSYCVPYDGAMTSHTLTAPVACTDWYTLSLTYVTYSGETGSTTYTRGTKSHGELNNDWSVFQSLPSDILTLEVTLTDYDGNVSEPVTYIFDEDGEPVVAEEFYRVFHLDAGRKYFSVTNIKALIDICAEANFNQMEIYFSDNQGFRFALDDMTITTEYGTYDLTDCLGDGYSTSSAYPDGSGKYLTQTEMDEIIAYANSKGIEIVPALNVPGHMGAILEEFPELCYSGYQSSIDLTSAEACAFAKALVKKYAEYFASRGCTYFNFCADEYANDNSNAMGYETIYQNGIYAEYFVPFFNEVAAIIKDEGMTPRAFNDGVYYNNDTSVTMDSDVQICYWSCGWDNYTLATPNTLVAMGYELINTHSGYYWGLGSTQQLTAELAADFDYTSFQGNYTVNNPYGAMFCVWCDKGSTDGQDDGAGVVEDVADVIRAFGATLPETREALPTIDDTYFPDAAVRAAVMAQVGPYVTDLTGYTGTLDLSGTDASDLTGIAEYLTGLTGLDLTGTAVTKITSDMVPDSLLTLDLTDCTELTYVELEEHPDLVVDFTGCSGILSLYLDGTNMTEINITAMKKLKNFVISNSQIGSISAASAASYTNAYYWNWENARLDLSDGTREGKLKDGIESYFATAVLEEEISETESVLLSGGAWNYAVNGSYKTFDLGEVSLLSSIDFTNRYYSYYGSRYSLQSATISVSEDGETYTEVATYSSDGAIASDTIELPEGTRARYIRVTQTGSNNCYTNGWYINGYSVAPTGFYYDGQQPELVRDEMEDVIYERDGKQYQLLDLLTANYETCKTIRGTSAADLVDAEWIDQDYLATASVAPSGVKVVITAEDGSEYVPSSIEEPELGTLDETTNVSLSATVVTQSAQVSSEQGFKALDGDTSTKWCADGTYTGWLGFTLEESMVIGKWTTVHAGIAESAFYNTQDYSLQILDPDGTITDDDFMDMTASEQKTILSDSSYWVDLDAVTGNSATTVTRTIDEDNLVEAQVYRLYVGNSVQDSASYGAIRIYEVELYAYTGNLKTNANGVFVADEIGTWNVSYQKRGEEIANINVRVRLSDQDLVDLSEQVEAARKAAEEAKRIAEEARAAAEEAQKKAEEAAASAAEDKAAALQAAEEAKAAQEAAEIAQKAAEDALAAAEAAAAAAAENNAAAVAAAAEAAEYAKQVAEAYAEIVQIKSELIDYLAQAQRAAEEAEASKKAAEEAQKKAEEAALKSAKYCALIDIAQIDLSSMNDSQKAAAEEAIAAAKEAIDAATTTEEVDAILAELKEAINDILGLVCVSEIFDDVSLDAWYHEALDYMVNAGYMSGVETNLFAPKDSMTRGQFVYVLYRIAGEPDVSDMTNPFDDVAEGKYYTNAVIWAYDAGVVAGKSETTFAPNDTITRSEIVSILYRYDGSNAVEENTLTGFADVDTVPTYAVEAMNWAVANGIVYGAQSGDDLILSPKTVASRAEGASFLCRYLTK